ncbi:MAG: CHAT domain-containing protein [Bacteroidota bacterium]
MIIFSFIQLRAQTVKNDTILAEKLLEKADTYLQAGNYTASNNLAIEAAEIFRNTKKWESWCYSYNTILYNGHYTKDYDYTIELIQQGLSQLPENEYVFQGRMHYFLGFCTNAIGDIWNALSYYEKSLTYFKKANDFSWIDRTLGNISQIYTQQGDYKKAQEYAKIAISYAKENKDALTIWKNTKSLGEAYFYAREFKKAQQTFSAAQQLQDDQDGTFELFEADILFQLGNYEAAATLTKKALRLATTCKTGTYICEDNVFGATKLLGQIYLDQQQPEKALQQFTTCLQFIDSWGDDIENGRLYILIGDAHARLQAYTTALENYQKALHSFIPSFKETDPSKNPPETLWTPDIWLMEIFKNKGDCFRAKYQSTTDTKWLHLTAEHYQLAVNSSELVRLHFSENDSKLLLGSYSNAFYEDLIYAKLELHALTKEVVYQEEAFQIAQRANAFVLRKFINEQKALQAANIPKETIAKFKQYEKELAIFNRKVKDSINYVQSLEKRIETKENFENLKKSIAKNYPKFDKLRNDLQGISVKALQARLNENTQLIKYFLGEETLYTFSITKEHFHIDQIAVPDDFETTIQQYRNALSDIDFIHNNPITAEAHYLQTASTLYNLLLKTPLQRIENKNITELTIIPDGILHTISFQALLMKPSKSWTSIANAVVKKYAIGYHYFCKMVGNTQLRTSQNKHFSAFGVAMNETTLNYMESLHPTAKKATAALRNSLSTLTFSADEAQQLAELMQGTSWIQEEATKTNFITQAMRSKSIHLATHALVNIENPDTSSLIFTKSNDNLSNLLRLDEIYNHTFAADMITLSACNTGFGKYHKGEGLQSLARAFNFANIPSVTATLWSIPDAASAKIMKLYYTYLQDGFPKHVALQKAQISYAENDEISSPASRLPFYWSAWTHIGDATSVSFKQKKGFSSYVILLFFLVYILIDFAILKELKK